jgi:polyisoprenoid-binding protein YceI
LSTRHTDRDADLRSPRFLNVEKFPKMTFTSIRILAEPAGQYTIEGNLALRGVTRPVSLAVNFSGIVDDPWGNTRAACQANTTINRKEFELLADLERETGGLLVGKDVAIKLSVEALLKK